MKKNDREKDVEQEEDSKALKEVVRLSEENEKLKEEVESWKNKYYEAYADLDNTRKVIAKDHENVIKYRASGFLEKLLPALDSFEMAFKFTPTDEKVKNYTKGFEMIYSQFEKALKEEGVTPICPSVGDKFDHNTMQAISTEDGEEDNLIKSVYLKGFYLKDRIIRPAMVIVTKKPSEDKE